jgi:hypothetical protein
MAAASLPTAVKARERLTHAIFLNPSWGEHRVDPEEKHEPRVARVHGQANNDRNLHSLSHD